MENQLNGEKKCDICFESLPLSFFQKQSYTRTSDKQISVWYNKSCKFCTNKLKRLKSALMKRGNPRDIKEVRKYMIDSFKTTVIALGCKERPYYENNDTSPSIELLKIEQLTFEDLSDHEKEFYNENNK